MKKFIIIYKLLDHERRTCTVIKFCIHGKQHAPHVWQWRHGEQMPMEAGQWAAKHEEWKKRIHEKVQEIIKQGHFAQGSPLGMLEEYRLCKICEKCKKVIINVSEGQTQPAQLALAKFCHKCVKKFSRGTKPQNKLDILSYEHHFFEHKFTLESTETEQSTNIVPVAPSTPQTGGAASSCPAGQYFVHKHHIGEREYTNKHGTHVSIPATTISGHCAHSPKSHSVHGYTNKHGTYVPPYMTAKGGHCDQNQHWVNQHQSLNPKGEGSHTVLGHCSNNPSEHMVGEHMVREHTVREHMAKGGDPNYEKYKKYKGKYMDLKYGEK